MENITAIETIYDDDKKQAEELVYIEPRQRGGGVKRVHGVLEIDEPPSKYTKHGLVQGGYSLMEVEDKVKFRALLDTHDHEDQAYRLYDVLVANMQMTFTGYSCKDPINFYEEYKREYDPRNIGILEVLINMSLSQLREYFHVWNQRCVPTSPSTFQLRYPYQTMVIVYGDDTDMVVSRWKFSGRRYHIGWNKHVLNGSHRDYPERKCKVVLFDEYAIVWQYISATTTMRQINDGEFASVKIN